MSDKTHEFTYENQADRLPWGMGQVIRGAEGSTGQTSSSANWSEIAKKLLLAEGGKKACRDTD